ncbi:uDENN domain-containing protein, partial [Gorgonomyces haynaldii]
QLHPLQYHFQPHVLYRYPKEDTNVAFPQHCPLFCFPNDVKFISSDTTPPAKCHSFIVTSESGSKMYGVAMVIYVKPNPDQQKQMEQWIEAWRSEHMDDSHLLMIQEIQTKMAMEKEQLLKLKSGQIHLDEEEMKEQMDLIHENIHLYEEMMSPLQPFTFTSENLYVGTAIGVLSQFPFYDFFKDWLCKLHNQMETEIQTGVISTIVERCAINLVSEIPMPPPGRLEIAVHLGASNFYVHRPPVNAISSIKN